MRRRKPHILLFVEDPGAANYIQYLPDKLEQSGSQCSILADGYAKKFLDDRKISYEPLEKTTSAHSILERSYPDILILGTSSNPDTYAFRMLTSARAMNIKSIGIVDNLSNAKFRFRGRSNDPLKYAPDWIVVPDHPTMQVFESLGFPSSSIRQCGHPQYDYAVRVSENWNSGDRDVFQNKFFPGIAKERKIFLFASTPFTGINPHFLQYSPDFTLKGRAKSRFETEVVLEEFLDVVNTLKPKPFLVLRIHPKQKPEDFLRYIDEFDLVSSGGSALELLYASDLIVGLPTMLLVEAVLLGKKTLAISANPKRTSALPTIRMGLTPCVFTREQLRSFLTNLLYNSPQPIRTDLSDLFVFGANKIIVELVEDILANQKQ